MNFNKHSEIPEGSHAFLSASNYHWVNYSPEKLRERYATHRAAQRGTALHEFAKQAIRLGQKLPRSPKTLNQYVNDGIGYRMTPEQPLFYSWNSFGTADTISFRKQELRIHDLKTGVSRTSLIQLEVYAALFCLEYNYKPATIATELRIYQNDEVLSFEPDPDIITHIMDRIVTFNKRIEAIRMEEAL